MILESSILGQLEYDEEKIITFPQGIIAFEQYKRYLLVENQDQHNPLWWLQSVDEPDLLFTVINPFVIKPDYNFELAPGDVEDLGIEKREDLVVLSIVVVPEDFKKMTANLLAPVVINARLKKGKQIILQDKNYSPKHLIIEELQQRSSGQQARPSKTPSSRQGTQTGPSKEECCHVGADPKKR